MRNVFSLIMLSLLLLACGESKQISPAQKQAEIEHAKKSSQAQYNAAKLAEHNEPAGFLKLFEIVTADITYTVESSEAAYDSLSLLLYTNTKAWVKTFSRFDQEKFKQVFKGVNDVESIGIKLSNEQFIGGILKNLEKIKGDKREIELVDYLKSILIPYHEELLKCIKLNTCN